MSDTTNPNEAPDVASLQAQVAALEADKMRADVAARTGIPVALLTGAGSTQEEVAAYADAVLAFTRPVVNSGLYVPNEGKNPGRPQRSEGQRFVQQLFNPDNPNY
jgi:hypothetical protein